jgi:uncharacterized protein (UPF0218 family)
MMPVLLLTEPLRGKLKEPLGKLIEGIPETILGKVRREILERKPEMIICVGDRVSRFFSQYAIRTDIRILDNVEMRHAVEPVKLDSSKRTFFVKNKPGTIDMSAWQAVAESIEAGEATVVVDGEEDLLGLAAIALAPVNSMVVYGQPKVGVVLVTVDKKMKREVNSIIKSMRKA